MTGEQYTPIAMADRSALDTFPVGCLTSHRDRSIAYANAYMREILGLSDDNLIGAPLSTLMTGGSIVLLDIYLLPLLAQNGRFSEILLHLWHSSGDTVPVIANAWIVEETGDTHWTFVSSVERDKLYEELISARRSLEERNAELLTRAATDSLTGLINRAEFDRHTETMIARAERGGYPVTFMLVDIDWFKTANDRFGHSVGDQVLRSIGALFRETVRIGDIVARYGGDEFALFLDGANFEEAEIVAARINGKVRQLDVTPAAVTVSIGVAVACADRKMQFADLFAFADEALYEAKRKGGDCAAVRRRP